MRLSGPAVTGIFEGGRAQRFFRYFLAHCKKGVNFCTGEKGTRLDFITFHVKGGGFPFEMHALKAVGERCFEGTRTFSTQGIDKAVFNMFRIYGTLGYEKLAFESDGARTMDFLEEPEIGEKTHSRYAGEEWRFYRG